MHQFPVLDRIVTKGTHTRKNMLEFTSKRDSSFGGSPVPTGTSVKFFEGANFGYLIWRDTKGRMKVAKE